LTIATFGDARVVIVEAAHRQNVALCRRCNAWQRSEPLGDFAEERDAPPLGDSRPAEIEAHCEQIVLPKARVERRQVAQRAHELQRADDKRERQRHLRHDERPAEPEPFSIVSDAAVAGLHRRRRCSSRRAQP
jgi:hypothetical protein